MTELVALPAASRRPRPGLLLSDDRLLRRAAEGDQRGFAAIFERYHQDLYRYCRAILGNPEDAQDALQNTMVKVLAALPGERRDIQLKPWLYRIAHNEAIDLLRRRRPTAPIDSEETPAPQPDPVQRAETQARLRQLIGDIDQLPERQRGALVMRELSGLSVEAIGEALGTTAAVARQAIYEARCSLRQMAEGREMSCERVMRAVSDGDRRILRGREVRAHLRHCSSCAAFKDAISTRRHDFAALSPLPAAASAGLLASLLGGGHGGSGAAGGALASGLGAGAGKTLATSAMLKSALAVVAVAAVGTGAADAGGLINLPLPGRAEDRPARSSATPAPAPAPRQAGQSRASADGKGVRAPNHSERAATTRSKKERASAPAAAAEGGSQHAPSPGPASHPAHGRAPSSPQQAAAHGRETAAAHQPTEKPAPAQRHPTPSPEKGEPASPSPPHSSPNPATQAPSSSPPPKAAPQAAPSTGPPSTDKVR